MKRSTLALMAVVVGTVAASGAAVVARSQAPQTPASQAVVMKGRAPVSNDMLSVKLPRPAEADLPSGLHLMVLEDRRLPQISFQLLVNGAGGYFDPADQAGLASITAAMMREGAGLRNTQQIAEQLETMAATVNTNTASFNAS